MFDKRGWTEDLGAPYHQGPTSVYSMAFLETPASQGVTDFHFFDNDDGPMWETPVGPDFEQILYGFVSSDPDLFDSESDMKQLIHVSPGESDYPHYDNLDSLLQYNEYDVNGDPYPTFYQSGAGDRPDVWFMISTGPFTITPGQTYPLHTVIFGSDDNPGSLDPAYYDFPVNTPYFNSSGTTDPYDRFADVYDNLDRAQKLYGNSMGGHIVALTAAAGGETLSGSADITWSASSATADPVNSVDILYSTDRGASWDTLAAGESNDGSYTLDTSTLPDGIFYRFRVIATDGALIGTASSSSDVTVNNPGAAAPQIMLLTPAYRGKHSTPVRRRPILLPGTLRVCR